MPGYANSQRFNATAELVAGLVSLDTRAVLRAAISGAFGGRIAVVSSFGTESAVILSLVAEIDRAVPILFLDTGKHFAETIAYRDLLVEHFKLTDLRIVHPAAADLSKFDPDGRLWNRNPNHCCYLRKVVPFDRALEGFVGWITGRKRYQSDSRATLPRVELVDGKVKINPLADWSPAQICAAFVQLQLPSHPLSARGYTSVGCAPCTQPAAPGSSPRSGRWPGSGKVECGIHRNATSK